MGKQEVEYEEPGEVPVEESILVPPGYYEGRLTVLGVRRGTDEETGEEYAYLDLEAEVTFENSEGNEETATLKFGYPFKVTVNTMLGKLLSRFGVPVKQMAGKDKTGISEHLDGRMANFSVIKDEKGFSAVERKTVEPAE